jgi:hypothetical protein
MAVKGAEAVRRQLGYFGQAVRTRVEAAATIVAETTRSQVVVDINTQTANPGYVVPEGATGRRAHIPSPPGYPPNSDTGRLAASYTTETTTGQWRVRSRVVAGVIYALWLEYGTRKMAPRPHLIPRFREQRPEFERRLKRIVDDEVRRANGAGK